jgi:GT2 family glycosyltransferase
MNPPTDTTARVSIVIPCHRLDGWDTLVNAVRCAQAQQPRPDEIIVVVDHNPELYYRARRDIGGVTVLQNQFQPGASGTRNTGAWHTGTELVAFLDGDITATAHWLAPLIAPFDDRTVIGTGGAITPAWASTRPSWLPDELLWAVGASYTGLPDTTAPVRNVWSASMVVRREAFTAVGGFRDGFGKIGGRNRPEDTELCIRMSTAGGRWMYVPTSTVQHDIPTERATFGFLLRRCYAEGRGKVQMARLLQGTRTLETERSYVTRTLPRAVIRGLATAILGDATADRPVRSTNAARAGTVIAAVAAVAAGGAVETLGAGLRIRHRVPAGTTR